MPDLNSSAESSNSTRNDRKKNIHQDVKLVYMFEESKGSYLNLVKEESIT